MNFFHKFILWVGTRIYRYKVYGAENLPEGGAVIPYNHYSVMDPFIIRHYYKGEMCFLAKKELFKNKFFASLLTNCGAIPVDRDNPDISSILTPIRLLRKGEKLAISPEGTRNKTGKLDFLPFKEGTILFAIKGRVPIVPCIVAKHVKPFRKTAFCFCKPIDFSQYYDQKLTDEDMAKLNDFLFEEMTKDQQEFLAFLADKKNHKKKKKSKTVQINDPS